MSDKLVLYFSVYGTAKAVAKEDRPADRRRYR